MKSSTVRRPYEPASDVTTRQGNRAYSKVAFPVLFFVAAVLVSTAGGTNECHAQSAQVNVLDPHNLPLGDGKVSTEPLRGYVYSCRSQFRGGGAQHSGGWIRGSTWDITKKTSVQGDVMWPNAKFTIAIVDGERRIVGNGLPINQTTGTFPVQASDPAYLIDRNPNRIEEQQFGFSLPLSPAFAPTPGCVPMGMIGIALNGVALFNALDDAGRDAVAHEVQDHCSGHPQMTGEYHYHGPSSCVPGSTSNNILIGYALDGFGIYSMYDEHGKELTNADLDECHGRVSRILWDGKETSMFHYVLTREYPYAVGCFRGIPVRGQGQRGGDSIPDAGYKRARQPPPEAIAACAGLSSGSQCRFMSPRGDTVSGACRSPAGGLACVPEHQ